MITLALYIVAGVVIYYAVMFVIALIGTITWRG